MRKVLLSLLLLVFVTSAMAQQNIQLRSADKAECVKSDMTSLKASFSFSTIEAQDYESERGTFSWLSLPNTVRGGNEGDPQIPVINQLIAVPFGAQPRVEITSYSTTDYRLEDYGMHTLVPRQPSLRKDKRPEDVPFVMNEAAYQTRGFRSEPKAVANVEGIMRGVQLGKMTIEPVSYDPVNNTIRVFNDIEVTVHFDGADAQATEQMLLDTYSPYFDIVYRSLFNGRAVTSVYDEHPDLYTTPVKMLVVTTLTYTNSTAFQNWLTWKKQKGIEVDVQTVTSSTSAADVRSLIQSRYNANHPSFLVIVGDETVVTNYSMWDYDSYYGNAATDLEYASVDGDIYHDMFMSRMPVASTTQLGNLVDKILMYEKYEMPDPSYLNETLLIAGWDEPQTYFGYTYPSWTNIAGKPTIQYANNNYFNSAHGITPHVFITTGSGQTTCYNYINNVGFINYTAHGDIQMWYDPNFTNTDVNNLTNTNKPFWAMGNCCLTANLKNAQNNQTCYGETMVRAANKGAFGYIGSMVESYWYEDFYFGVGAFNASYSTNNNPSVSSTSVGAYDALFDDTGFNTLNSVPYIGNLAVSYAYACNYTNSETDPCSPEYYWRCYQCYGDGSVMPYLNVPAANNVSHASTLSIGANSFTVNADAGSYVSITVNNEIIGVAAVPANSTSVNVSITPQTTAGTAMVVVTRNQRQPYINTIDIVSNTQYTISTTVNPSNGGTVEGAGTYYETAVCTLTATPNVPEYEFANWTLGNEVVGTEASYSFTVTGDATYTANFTALTAHNITCSTIENGSISADKTTAYKNETVTLTATPNTGYFFADWTVRDANNQPVAVTNNQFTMPDSDVTVSANFTSGFVVTLNQTEHGTISADQTCFEPGAIVTLTATPDANCVFEAWYVYKTGNPRDVIAVVNDEWFFMPASDVTVMAVFVTEEQHEQTVGSGNSTNQYIPTRLNRSYSLSQQIYTATEIGYQGRITAIAFKANGTGTRTLDIYMAHTDKTAFTISSGWSTSSKDWEVMGSVSLVYSGSVSFVNGWATITLATPFEYDGVSNLNICVADKTGSAGTSRNFSTYNTGAYRAIYINSNNTNYSAGVGYSNQLEGYSGTPLQSNNQIKFTIKVPGSAESLTVSPDGMNSFNYEEGHGPSDTEKLDIIGVDLNNDITITAPEDFEISLTEDGTYGQSLTIPRETSKRSRNVTTWDFEGSLEGWTAVDVDNDSYTWGLASEVLSGFAPHAGSDVLTSASYVNGVGALHPDNWLISPQVELGGSFSMWACPQQAAYPAEHFAIEVSITDTDPSNFILLGEWTLSSGNWKQYSVDLSAFAGQMGYIAVRHYDCTDQFYINVDDFVLDTDAAITIEMPVTITPASVFVRMKANLGAGVYNGTLTAGAGSLTSDVSLSGEVTISTFTKTITPYTGTNDHYYLIASPVVGVTPSEDNGFLTNNYDLYYYDQTQDKEWRNYKANPFVLEPGKGYLYANSGDDTGDDVTLIFAGVPYSGNGEVPLVYDAGVNQNTELIGWNLVGNPFAQPANINSSFYRMNEDGTGLISASGAVDAMEGVFVQATGENQSVTFSTSVTSKGGEQLIVNLSQNRGAAIDRVIIGFSEGDVLPKFMLNGNNTKLYIPQGNVDYAVVRSAGMGELPLNFKAAEDGTYTLTVSATLNSQLSTLNFNYLHLIDNMTGMDVDLLVPEPVEGPASYTFTAKTTDYESRFKLVFVGASTGSAADEVFAFYSNGNWIINNDGKATLQIVDVNEHLLCNEQINGCCSKSFEAAPGVYMLRLINGENVKTQKIVVR